MKNPTYEPFTEWFDRLLEHTEGAIDPEALAKEIVAQFGNDPSFVNFIVGLAHPRIAREKDRTGGSAPKRIPRAEIAVELNTL